MIFEQIAIGGDRNFSYLVADEITKTAIIFDPAYNVSHINKIIQKKELIPKYIILTHSHEDHVNGIPFFKTNYPSIETVMHISTDFDVDIQINDEDVWDVDDINLKFIHTPGHSKDSMCILINDKMLISGDTLFVGKIGGTGPSFPDSDSKTQWNSLHKLLDLMDDNVEVWPGHDYGSSKNSTMENEEKNNPFLLCKTFEEFMNLKNNWIKYKKEHRIK